MCPILFLHVSSKKCMLAVYRVKIIWIFSVSVAEMVNGNSHFHTAGKRGFVEISCRVIDDLKKEKTKWSDDLLYF